MADLGGSAVFVVGDDFYDKSGFSGAESFVGQFFQSNIAEFSATALNRPLNVVFGHVNGARAVNGDAERKIHFRVAALARGNRDDVGDFGKNRTAFGVSRRFFPFCSVTYLAAKIKLEQGVFYDIINPHDRGKTITTRINQ